MGRNKGEKEHEFVRNEQRKMKKERKKTERESKTERT